MLRQNPQHLLTAEANFERWSWVFKVTMFKVRSRNSLSRELPKYEVKFLTIMLIWWQVFTPMTKRCSAYSHMQTSSTDFFPRISPELSISLARFCCGRSYITNSSFISSNRLVASTDSTSTDAKCSTAINFCSLL